MRQFFHKYFAIVALVALALSSNGAMADDITTKVIVPDAPGGALVAGCYRATGPIYKSYHFSFCLEQRGTYRVTGGGVVCSGKLNWAGHRGVVDVKLQRTQCGNGVAWSADTMSCHPQGLLAGIIGRVLVPSLPHLPYLAALRCDYRPAPGTGERPIRFVARRMHL